VDAFARREAGLAGFYRRRFRAEFRPAVDAWVATRPLENPDAPLTPFAMPEYRLRANVEAERLKGMAEAAGAEASRDILRASDYVLAAVLFAVVLFFGGIGTRLESTRARGVVLAMGCAVLLGTVAWIATFPVSVSI
jgi:hypothetical protein